MLYTLSSQPKLLPQQHPTHQSTELHWVGAFNPTTSTTTLMAILDVIVVVFMCSNFSLFITTRVAPTTHLFLSYYCHSLHVIMVIALPNNSYDLRFYCCNLTLAFFEALTRCQQSLSMNTNCKFCVTDCRLRF